MRNYTEIFLVGLFRSNNTNNFKRFQTLRFSPSRRSYVFFSEELFFNQMLSKLWFLETGFLGIFWNNCPGILSLGINI